MIYRSRFLGFLEIGAVSFGGGYSMIPLIRELTISQGWLTEEELLNFIAVSESTPGPIAINMATFVGSSQGGIFGSFCATLGVVLPSFIIILIGRARRSPPLRGRSDPCGGTDAAAFHAVRLRKGLRRLFPEPDRDRDLCGRCRDRRNLQKM